jgi:hypothetical protein
MPLPEKPKLSQEERKQLKLLQEVQSKRLHQGEKPVQSLLNLLEDKKPAAKAKQ